MGILANENAIETGGYNIANSLRFQSASSQYLSRTPASTSNRQKWTWSAWVKRGTLGSDQSLFSAGVGSSGNVNSGLAFGTDNAFYVYGSVFGISNDVVVNTSQVFRDTSAWYHIVVAIDTTQATASNRVKVYVNGVQVTAFSTATYPTLNYQTAVNLNVRHAIGTFTNNTSFFDGYQAEINFIDGQALTPSSFGETNTLTGQWVAKKYTGTYGTNGFYLPFSNGTSTTTLGADSSGNSNNWTLNNFTRSAGVSDCWMYDVPSGNGSTGTQPNSNYAVMNPLAPFLVPLEANLRIAQGAASWNSTGSTIYPTTGKWYVEATATSLSGANYIGIGLRPIGQIGSGEYTGSVAGSYGGILGPGQINPYNGGVLGTVLTGTFTGATPISMAVDFDAGKVWFGSNNLWCGGGNPAAGTSPTYTFTPNTQFNIYFAAFANNCYANFGQRAWTYTPPSGFKALCTANLPTSTIVKGNQYMDATTYSGQGTNLTLVNAGGFQPDIVWMKCRSNADDNALVDSVRGTAPALYPNSTTAEISAGYLTSFNSNGVTITTGYGTTNIAGRTYVAWQWDAGSSTVTNTSGTISSQVRANSTAGVSVVTWTGSGSGSATVGHGLGVAPKMVIARARNSNDNWWVYHQNLTSAAYYLVLNSTAAQSNATYNTWNSTAPSSSVITLGSAINGSFNYVAYCFAEIAGFSKFGSYTGNGSADGVFTFTGFTPRWVLIKQSSTSGNNWQLIDTARETTNPNDTVLFPNTSGAEGTLNATIDVLSNGFKIRTTDGSVNTNGATYIYACFASNPFAQSNAF